MDNLHNRLKVELSRKNEIFYYGYEKHLKISRIATSGCKMLYLYEFVLRPDKVIGIPPQHQNEDYTIPFQYNTTTSLASISHCFIFRNFTLWGFRSLFIITLFILTFYCIQLFILCRVCLAIYWRLFIIYSRTACILLISRYIRSPYANDGTVLIVLTKGT